MENAGEPPLALVGHYRLLSLIGEGGSGRVYRAWDPRLQREVALKVLRDRSGAEPARLQRFIEEARAASALNHPNIVTVYDAAVAGTPFIVTELVEGRRLRDELGRGPLPLRRTLDVATQIADGLSAAHAAGMVHRDLKPENLMLSRDGRVKILDFGLARTGGLADADTAALPRTDDQQTQTELGLRAGTVPYMSPEQARGGGPIGFQSDQFSLGLILYEMLAGRSPFRRDTAAATLDAIINDEPPLAAIESRAPIWLRWIVEHCLAKDPHERYASTADLHRDLKTLRDRLAEAARGDAAAKPDRSQRWLIAGLATAIVVVIGAVSTLVMASRSTPDTAALRFTPLATEAGYEGLPAWSPDGQTIAYAAEIHGVLEIFTRRVEPGAAAAQVTSAAYDCRYPFWSADGKRIYYVSLARDQEAIWSISAAGGTPQVAIANAMRGAMSPDGRTLAFLRDELQGDIVGAARLWLSTPGGIGPWPSEAVDAAAARYDALGDLRIIEGAFAFSPDGRTLGLSMVPRTINLPAERRGWQFWLLPLAGGPPVRRLQWWTDPIPRAASFSWLGDSRRVVMARASLTSAGSDLWVADVIDDRAWPLTTSPDSELDPASAPGGEQVAFTKGESNYDVVELSAGGLSHPLIATTRNESDPVWSPNGQLMAYVSDRDGQEQIWLTSREGERWRERPLITQRDFGDDHTIMLGAPAFSPDGQRIAYERNAQKPIWPLRIWISLTSGGAPVPLLPPSHEGYQSAPTWSPDGQWIAYTEWKDQQWTLAKVRVGTGEPPMVLRTDGMPNATPHWSPANDWITWATERGFVLVSPDGASERLLTGDQWIAHTWSRSGNELFGIRDTEQLRLQAVAVDPHSGRTRVLADLGASPPVNNPVKGLSVGADGRTLVTSMIGRVAGDVWLLDGLTRRQSWWRWPLRFP